MKEKKVKKTFTLDGNVFDRFSTIASIMAINKSKFIENKLREFINLNSDER
jgi:hypothetical protein